jgi:hypothetical protein
MPLSGALRALDVISEICPGNFEASSLSCLAVQASCRQQKTPDCAGVP